MMMLNTNRALFLRGNILYVEILHTHDSRREDADSDLKTATPGPPNTWGVLMSLF